MTVLKRLVEEINLILRGFRGYGAGHPWSPRKSQNLGKSEAQRIIDQNKKEPETKEDNKIKVSKVFLEKDEEFESEFDR
jgi:hypothetical protein